MQISLEKYEAMLDRIAQLESVLDKHRCEWISVKDRLPSYEMMVMVYSEHCGIGLAFIDNRDEKWCGDCQDDVQYWMPFPEPPEVKK